MLFALRAGRLVLSRDYLQQRHAEALHYVAKRGGGLFMFETFYFYS